MVRYAYRIPWLHSNQPQGMHKMTGRYVLVIMGHVIFLETDGSSKR